MTDSNPDARFDRRAFTRLSAAGMTLCVGLGAGGRASAKAVNTAPAFTALRDKPLTIGVVVFPDMDQIDFTGPFEVLSRLPGARIVVIGAQKTPFKDCLGLTLTPDCDVAGAPELDILQVPGGPGQQAMMDREPVLALIRSHVDAGKPLFSVCTGALVCGAAGVLMGRRATTHWAAFDLLPYFGAIPVRQRVVIDGTLVSAAGVTAGLDGALQIAALLRGEDAAERIQLEIQYAPEPPFHAGSPETAPSDVRAAVESKYQPLVQARLQTAKTISQRLGVKRS